MAVETRPSITFAPLTWGTTIRDWVSAVVTGQFAGVMMLATMMIFSLAEGGTILDPLRAIGSIGVGDPDLREGHWTVLRGLALHQLGFTLFWSLVFAALTRWADRRNFFSVTAFGFSDHYGAAVLGLLVGMCSNLIDVIVVMPAFAQGAEWTQQFLGIRSWCYHLVFGLGLSMWPFIRQRMYP